MLRPSWYREAEHQTKVGATNWRHTTPGLPVKLRQFALWPFSKDCLSPFKRFLFSRLRQS